MNNGQWVTLHIQHFGGGKDRTLLGYLESTTPGYRLTKLVVQQVSVESVDGFLAHGIETKIHQGVWIVAPQFVWMVEYEETAPVAGFVPSEEY